MTDFPLRFSPSAELGNVPCSSDMKQAIARYGRELREAIPDNLIGVYLYGSMVSNSFIPGLSDIDFIVVVRSGVEEAQRKSILDVHARSEIPADATFVTAAQVNINAVPSQVEFVVRPIGAGRLFRVPNGTVDFLLNRQDTFDHGLCILGPAVRDLFQPVPRIWLNKALEQLIDVVVDRVEGQGANAKAVCVGILMLCRILHTMINGRMVSKTEGAEWAVSALSGEWRDMIDTAARSYKCGSFSGTQTLDDLKLFKQYCMHFLEEHKRSEF